MTIPKQMPDILVKKPHYALTPAEVERCVKRGLMEYHKEPAHSGNPVKEPKKQAPSVFCRWCGGTAPPTKEGLCRRCGKPVKAVKAEAP